MLKKLLAAKTAAVVGAVTVGVVAAGATVGIVAEGEDVGLETTDTTIEETTTTVEEDTTTTVEDTTTTEQTTTTLEETTTTVVEEATTPTSTTTTEPDEADDPAVQELERGPDPHGPARHGLCRAFGHRTEGPGRSVAADNLRAAAELSGQTVEEFCADVLAAGGDDQRSRTPTRDGERVHPGKGHGPRPGPRRDAA